MYKKVLFLGSKELGYRVLNKIYALSPQELIGCITIDDEKDTRSYQDLICAFCENANLQCEVVNAYCDLMPYISKYSPDICFVVGWYSIISQECINAVPGGFIGIHNSLLPLYRGQAPVVWAMINGEDKTGFSVFSFDSEMDSGDLWYQEEIPIYESDYISDVLNRISERILVFFDTKFVLILQGKIEPYKQGKNNASYGAKRTEKDGIIDWNKSAEDIYNFIRAQSEPYPGAFSYYGLKRISILESRIYKWPVYGQPGQLVLVDKKNREVVVACGNRTGLVLSIVKIENKGCFITDIIRGLELRVGEKNDTNNKTIF